MSESYLDDNAPGVGRLNFFLGKLSLIAASIATVILFGQGSPLVQVIGLAVMIASFILDVKRLQNIGVSPWFAMLRFIPYVNVLYTIGLLSAQAGWVETRRLDKNGMTIAVFLGVLLVVGFLMVMRLHMAVPTFF